MNVLGWCVVGVAMIGGAFGLAHQNELPEAQAQNVSSVVTCDDFRRATLRHDEYNIIRQGQLIYDTMHDADEQHSPHVLIGIPRKFQEELIVIAYKRCANPSNYGLPLETMAQLVYADFASDR